MQTKKTILDIIRSRSSWRSYNGQPISDADREKLTQFIENLGPAPFGGTTRFQIVEQTGDTADQPVKLGTYGFIKGAQTFIAGTFKQSEKSLEDFGYQMERIILFAEELGLGSCWLAGSFKKSSFAAAMNASEDEVVPAVTPIGYKEDKRALRDSFVRWSARSKNRFNWEKLFFKSNFDTPLNEKEAGDYAEVLEMVRLAPSGSNKQPWRIVQDGNSFHFYMQRTKGYDKMGRAFGVADVQRLDMGIAFAHFDLAAQALGLNGQWEINDPGMFQMPNRTEYVASWKQ